MIKLHYLNNSRAQRILFMLEEMGIPYETEVFFREKNLAPTTLKNVHPLGKSPVITDGDLTIAESGAIIEYLAEKYGKGSMIPEVLLHSGANICRRGHLDGRIPLLESSTLCHTFLPNIR